MQENSRKFKQLLEERPFLRAELTALAQAFDGNHEDDRAVFDAVIAPMAKAHGMPFTYDEALAAMHESRELSDEDLELVTGGINLWQRVVSGALAVTMVAGMAPMTAFAEGRTSEPAVSVVSQYLGDDESGLEVSSELAELPSVDVGIPQDMAEEAVASYAADFSNEDIATPEGIEATNEGLLLTASAPEPVLLAATEVAAASKPSNPAPAGQNDWDKTGKSIDYTVEALGYVSKDAENVGRYGKVLFNFIKAGCLGDYGAAFGGGLELLKLTGLLHRGGDVSNAQIQQEVKELRVLVEAMSQRLDENTKQTYQNRLVVFDNAVGTLEIDCKTVEAMFAKAAAIANERGEGLAGGDIAPTQPAFPEDPVYPEEPTLGTLPEQVVLVLPDEPEDKSEESMAAWQQACDEVRAQFEADRDAWGLSYLQVYADYVNAYRSWKEECERIQDEYRQQVSAYESWNEEAALAEWEALREADAAAYLQRLVKIMEDEERAGNKDFKNFTKTMDGIESNFKLVSVECAKREGSSPFHAFDSYWNLYFNWETQGYYLRQAYRTNAEYQLKRSYALLAAYYDMASYTGEGEDIDPRESLTEALGDALNGIEALPAGQSPESIDSEGNFRVRCLSFGRTAVRGYAHFFAVEEVTTDDAVREYQRRLHGMSVLDDLKLAGLYSPQMDSGKLVPCPDNRSWWTPAGIGIRGAKGRRSGIDRYYAVIMHWDGSVTPYGIETGDWNTQYHCKNHFTYWWFDFV